MEKFNLNSKTFVAYPNDKVSINDITLKIPYHAVVTVFPPVKDGLQISIAKIEKLEKIEI